MTGIPLTLRVRHKVRPPVACDTTDPDAAPDIDADSASATRAPPSRARHGVHDNHASTDTADTTDTTDDAAAQEIRRRPIPGTTAPTGTPTPTVHTTTAPPACHHTGPK
ncbi:hypothetical protein ACFQ51_25420 [Streptomyces kaempferi]